MTLEELKDQTKSVEERTAKLLADLKLTGNERSVIAKLSKGDLFNLMAMDKSPMDDNQQSDFTPIVFVTDKGARIGAKQFVGVEIDDDAPAVGLTSLENAAFLVYCVDHHVTFKVDKKTTEEIEATPTRKSYTKNTYKLSVEDYD